MSIKLKDSFFKIIIVFFEKRIIILSRTYSNFKEVFYETNS